MFGAGRAFQNQIKDQEEKEEIDWERKQSGTVSVVNRWLIVGVVLLIVFIVLTISYIGANKSYKYNQMDIRPIAESDLTVNDGVEDATKGYTTIALYGVDSRDANLNTGSYSDRILLFSIYYDT